MHVQSCFQTCFFFRPQRRFPNMVLRKNEYSRALNASYTFQPLMSFSISFSWVIFTLQAKEKGNQLPLPKNFQQMQVTRTHTRLPQLRIVPHFVKDSRASEVHKHAWTSPVARKVTLFQPRLASPRAPRFSCAVAHFSYSTISEKEWGTSSSLHTNVKIFKSCNLLHEKLQHLYLFEVRGELAYSG